MNFRKGSKRQLTPTLHPSEWSLSLEIMCMHFILSGPRTSLHIFEHIHCKKIVKFPKRRGGPGGRKPFGFFAKIHSIWKHHLSLIHFCTDRVFYKSLNSKYQIGINVYMKWSIVLYLSIRDSSTKKAIKIASVVAGVIFPAPRKILFSEPCDALEKAD